MAEKPKLLERFRKALKAEAKHRKNQEGRGYQSKLAKKAKVSKAYLSDIALARKPGSEEVRHRIAEALGYNYNEFIELGGLLLEGNSLEEAKTIIKTKRILRPETDGTIEHLLVIWPELTTQGKKSIYQLARQSRFNTWLKNRKLSDLPDSKEARLKYIWNEVFSEANLAPTYHENIFEMMNEYKEGLLSDLDIFDEAKDHLARALNN